MKILITGSDGYLGSHLVSRLRVGHEITKFDPYPCSFDEWMKQWNEISKYGATQDYVIHAGAILSRRKADVNITFQMNTMATQIIARDCRMNNWKLLYVSSCAAIEPVSVYGWSKHIAEMFVRCFHPDSVIVRPFNIWGDENEYKDPSIVQKILTGKLEYIFKDCVRDFTHVNDVVECMIEVVEKGFPARGTYEIGTGLGTHVSILFNQFGHGQPRTFENRW